MVAGVKMIERLFLRGAPLALAVSISIMMESRDQDLLILAFFEKLIRIRFKRSLSMLSGKISHFLLGRKASIAADGRQLLVADQ